MVRGADDPAVQVRRFGDLPVSPERYSGGGVTNVDYQYFHAAYRSARHSNDRSTAGALWVRHPSEIASTPVAATSAARSIVIRS